MNGGANEPAIRMRGVEKRFGSVHAVRELDLDVPRGSLCGFLGPNGAGKSTTMRVIAGFLPASSGRVTVCGHDITTQATAAKACIGYLPEGAPSYPEMTPRAFLDFVADIRGMRGESRRARLAEIYGLLHLEHVLEQSIDTLSKGYKRRVGLAQALLHDPKVLILDEPASGLDPRARIELRELLKELTDMGKTILISSHILTELSELCNRIAIIEKGQLIFEGPRNALNKR